MVDFSEHVESCPSTSKNVISPQPQYLLPPNLTGWKLSLRDSYLQSLAALESRGPGRSPDKLKNMISSLLQCMWP